MNNHNKRMIMTPRDEFIYKDMSARNQDIGSFGV